MTILLGIICDEGIVVASDSQGTIENFSVPTDKISVVQSGDDSSIIAKAGSCLLANRVVEIIQEKAVFVSISDPRQLAGFAEGAIRQIRDQMVDDDQKKYLEDNPFQLLIAQCGPLMPTFYITDSVGISNKVDTFYAVAGCGAVLAECLLNEFIIQPKTIAESIAIAVYIVSKVKRYDAFCGGPTIIKVAPRIANDGGPAKVVSLSQDFVDHLERELDESEKNDRPKRTEMLSNKLQKIGVHWVEKHLKPGILGKHE